MANTPQSRNPVLNREFNDPARYATFEAQGVDAATLQEQYAPPAATSTADRMTVQDVVVRTAILFVLLLPMAIAGWNLGPDYPLLVWGSMLVGLGLGLANAFKRNVSPPLIMVYAVVQGLFLGGISRLFNQTSRHGELHAQRPGPARPGPEHRRSGRPGHARGFRGHAGALRLGQAAGDPAVPQDDARLDGELPRPSPLSA